MSTCEGVEGPWGAWRPLGASTRELQPEGTPASLQGGHVSVPGVPDMCVSVRGQGVPRRAGLKRPTSSVAVGRWGSGSMSAHVCGHTRVCMCAIMARVCVVCVHVWARALCMCVHVCMHVCTYYAFTHVGMGVCARVCLCAHYTFMRVRVQVAHVSARVRVGESMVSSLHLVPACSCVSRGACCVHACAWSLSSPRARPTRVAGSAVASERLWFEEMPSHPQRMTTTDSEPGSPPFPSRAAGSGAPSLPRQVWQSPAARPDPAMRC